VVDLTAPVVLTRAVGANDRLGAALTGRGIPWVEWPAVAFDAVAVAPDALDGVTALAFVSPAAVAMAGALRWPDVPRVAQGAGTALALVEAGDRADVVADPPDADGLAAAVIATVPAGPVAIVRGDHGRDVAPERLRAAGYEVRPVTVYRNLEPADLGRPPQAVRAVVYASPSAVRRLLGANPWLRDVPAVAIGPTTAEALGDHPDVRIAASPTPEALLATLLESV